MGDPLPAGRVLVLTRNFPPLRGGMERLNLEIVRILARHFPTRLVAPAGCRAHAPESVSAHEVRGSGLAAFLFGCMVSAVRIARSWRPGIVLAGSGLCAPMAWVAARLAGARAVVYAHGLDLIAAHPVYRIGWLPFIRRADLVLVNSANTSQLAREAGVPADRIRIVHPGTNLPGELRTPGALRLRLGVGEAPLLLSVGRSTPRKGVAEFVHEIFPMVLAQHPSAMLVIVGDDGQDALLRQPGGGRARILLAAEQQGVKDRLVLLGACDQQTLEQAYADADVHVFPIRRVAGDVEGFGMVAVEAAAHGLPTVAFAVGGVADAVLQGSTGRLVQEGRRDEFAAAVLEAIGHGRDPAWRARCRAAAVVFGWDRFERALMSALGEMVDGDAHRGC